MRYAPLEDAQNDVLSGGDDDLNGSGFGCPFVIVVVGKIYSCWRRQRRKHLWKCVRWELFGVKFGAG